MLLLPQWYDTRNSRRKVRKPTNTWKVNNVFWKNRCVKEKNQKRNKKIYLEKNENESTICQFL